MIADEIPSLTVISGADEPTMVGAVTVYLNADANDSLVVEEENRANDAPDVLVTLLRLRVEVHCICVEVVKVAAVHVNVDVLSGAYNTFILRAALTMGRLINVHVILLLPTVVPVANVKLNTEP
jgi:hypothetical protein